MLDQGAPSGAQHFSCKFSHKMALVTCPGAFRLRRLCALSFPRSWSVAFCLSIVGKIPNRVSTLWGSYGRSKGRCWVGVLHLASVFSLSIPAQNCSSNMSMCILHVHVHFTLRRLAQSLPPELSLVLGHGIFLVISRIKWLL